MFQKAKELYCKMYHTMPADS